MRCQMAESGIWARMSKSSTVARMDGTVAALGCFFGMGDISTMPGKCKSAGGDVGFSVEFPATFFLIEEIDPEAVLLTDEDLRIRFPLVHPNTGH